MTILVGIVIALIVLYVLTNVLSLFLLMLENEYFYFAFAAGLAILVGLILWN